VLLRREGWPVNYKRIHRLYQLEGLQLRMLRATAQNTCACIAVSFLVRRTPRSVGAWILFHDQLFDGRPMRVLTIVDQFNSLSPLVGASILVQGPRCRCCTGTGHSARASSAVDHGRSWSEFISWALETGHGAIR